MQTSQYTQLEKKGGFEHVEPFRDVVVVDEELRVMIHRRGAEIHGRIRLIRSRLKTNKERLVFDYICDNTIGRGKSTDQIANSQFMKGKRCRRTGKVIDSGCGLTSVKPIREARQSLLKQGIIFEERVDDIYGASSANRYGLCFIRDLLEFRKAQKKLPNLRKHTPRGYYEMPTTIKSPTEIIKQRYLITPKKKNNRKLPTHFMDRDRVDYLIDHIEKITGDTHSRGAFAEIVLAVDEGQIMEILSILKDRDNIYNKGAWFLAVARKYQNRPIIRADAPPPPEKRGTLEQEKPIQQSVSFTKKLLKLKPELADLFDMKKKLQRPAVHHKFIVGT
jgi:hypothetical protein